MKSHNSIKTILAVVLLWVGLSVAQAFVMMGIPDANEAAQFNYTDEFGAPKDINHQGFKRFFRWNNPYFVYSFDASFINYFGLEGMDAVNEAFTVVNDFFVNEDYQGVSQLDLNKHGFAGNYNTTWINTTAQNAQIIDIKTLVLGMIVDQLGIGNPHRWAFSITGTHSNVTASQIIFETRLRNYDPISYQPTDVINGVKYSYRLIHDASNIVVGTPTFTTADMEEFTTDTSGNAWTSLSAITDAFYGNTSLWWTDTPSLFNFGIYYDGMNAMGGQYKPRHALTYDDAGGLKYLYSTNNFIFEQLQADVVLIEPAQYLPAHLAVHYPQPSGRQLPIFPGRAAGIQATPTLTTTFMGLPGLGAANPTGIMDQAMRGGIDKMQFYHRPFDSLLGLNFIPTNFTWMDTFIFQNSNPNVVNISDANGRNIGTLNNSRRGIQWNAQNADITGATFWQQPNVEMKFLSQKVGRNVAVPDLIFVADDIQPPSPDGVPIGWQRPTNSYVDLASLNGGFVTNASAEVGPGIISGFGAGLGQGEQITFNNTFSLNNVFEMIWSGEASLVGSQEGLPSLWGWIKGPGPNDVITFPQGRTQWIVENSVIPDTAPPTITMVSDNGGATAIEEQTLTRTEETLTLIGNELASVTAIEIMIGDLVVQTIMPAEQYVVSNQRMDIPAGIISDTAEGAACTVRVWNSIGASEVGPQTFKIETGRPVIAGTDYDNAILDRAQAVTIQGYGFKSKTAGETQLAWFRVDDSTGAAIDDNGTAGGGASNGLLRPATFEVISDTLAVLPINSITANADGPTRRLRVARKTVTSATDVDNVLSPGTNNPFSYITTKPVVSTLTQLESDGTTWTTLMDNGAFRRDRVLEINGTALNTASVIEVIQEDGTSFANPVFIQLPNAGVTVEDNGTRILMSADTIPYSDADTNTTAKRAFKIYNAVGNTDLNASQMFAVNTQPVFDAIGAFANAGYMNRDKVVGDDLNIFGSGLKAVSQVIFSDDNDTTASRVTINLPAPGITVADNQISIDTQTYQVGSGADTDVNSSRRVLRLVSARDEAIMPLAQRFYAGAPPTISSLSGISNGNYTRHNATLALTGTGFGHVTQLEIVDIFGNSIAGVPAIVSGADGTGGTGLNIDAETSVSVDANATGWATTAYLLDSVTASTRRVKITTPFGIVTSFANATGAFTVSAAPTLVAIPGTFAGGGYTADDLTDTTDENGTYDKSDGDLIINGADLRGVSTIAFYSGASGSVGENDGNFTVDPLNPPAGISFNAAGTQITIDNTVVPAGWVGDDNATIGLVSVAGVETNSSIIQTQE